MPSMAIHLAVANEYVKRYKIKNFTKFRHGVLMPDLIGLQGQAQKEQAHFSNPLPPEPTAKQCCYVKVNLFKYLSEHSPNNDFEKGYFLHLITDYYFFNCVIARKPNINKSHFKTLYPDYEKMALDMEQNYGVDNSDTPWAGIYKTGEPELFTRAEIYKLIDICAQINLKDIEAKIRQNPQNWRKLVNTIFDTLWKKP